MRLQSCLGFWISEMLVFCLGAWLRCKSCLRCSARRSLQKTCLGQLKAARRVGVLWKHCSLFTKECASICQVCERRESRGEERRGNSYFPCVILSLLPFPSRETKCTRTSFGPFAETASPRSTSVRLQQGHVIVRNVHNLVGLVEGKQSHSSDCF